MAHSDVHGWPSTDVHTRLSAVCTGNIAQILQAASTRGSAASCISRAQQRQRHQSAAAVRTWKQQWHPATTPLAQAGASLLMPSFDQVKNAGDRALHETLLCS